ncbi:trypsin-like [Coccinella septempunctata]|uniref:trypsin-like n=1 Tax=Coccinella septempunctata TaxID=41139 RepID=UPI001D08787D|nr:trypsin-like [Coccinella septempunctata]
MKLLDLCCSLVIFRITLAVNDPTCTFANYPFVIGIKETFSFKHVCGGSLVKPNTVLTLASCVIERKDIPGFFTAVAGPSSIGRVGSQRIIAQRVVVHKRFDRSRGMNDVGLLILSSNFELSNLVSVVRIPEQYIAEDIGKRHTRGVAIGWGPYHPGKRLTDDNRYLFNPKLNCIRLTILSESKCKMVRKGFGYEPNKICAWVPQGDEDLCQGDAGGPLVSNGTQYGIVSVGFGCDSTKSPAFYERIDRVLDIFMQPYQIDIEYRSISIRYQACSVTFISVVCSIYMN